MSTQASFTPPEDRSREIIKRCADQYADEAETTVLTVSGGTDSVVAADLVARIGPEYGIDPDAIAHIDTGAGIPQSRLVAKVVADMHDLDFIVQGYRQDKNSLAHRILGNGWPGAYGGSPMTGGHGLEWANRKDKPMNAVYMMFEGLEIWVSGARKLESKQRSGNVPDSGIEQDRPRRIWLSPISGWTSAEKQEYIKERGLPVSEAYLILGFSGECTACAFDEVGLLTNIDILSPELGHAIRTLAVWLYQRVKRGDVELEPKRLCWGWEPEDVENDPEQSTLTDTDTAQAMVGCDEDSCSTREQPDWILDLPEWQIVDRVDVKQDWDGETITERFGLSVEPNAEQAVAGD